MTLGLLNNSCTLYKMPQKSSSDTFVAHIIMTLTSVWFHGISTIESYLKPNHLI